jgi:hypothetical protein
MRYAGFAEKADGVAATQFGEIPNFRFKIPDWNINLKIEIWNPKLLTDFSERLINRYVLLFLQILQVLNE